MQAFLQSAFLQALAGSLIASIWQMALLWAVTTILFKLLKFTSSQKFNIAFIAQITGLVFFIYTFFTAYNTHEEKIIDTIIAGDLLSNANLFIVEWMPYLSIIYLCILLFQLGGFIFIYNESKTLRKYQLKKISAENRIFVQQMSELFSLHRKVKIYLSEKISCPLTIGFLKPIILIPVAAVNHLTTEQMEAVILHELAHIKRADYLLFILQSLADKIFFFNIFSKMLGDIIEQERENACDDWVLQFRYNSMHYAEALFKLGRLKTLPVLAMPLTGKKESLLLVRIKRLLHNTQSSNTYSLQSGLLGLFSIMIAAGLFISSSIKPAAEKIISTDNPVALNQTPKIQVVSEERILPAEVAAVKQAKKNSFETKSFAKDKVKKTNSEELIYNDKAEALSLKENYFVKLQQSFDSLHYALPDYREALNSRVMITPEALQKAISYQNFQQIESMLAASGNAINITEADSSKNSYQKQITIEAKDKKGNKHVYTVIVELYQ